jgi:branched-chain amino acid transport system substrate-binding protein
MKNVLLRACALFLLAFCLATSSCEPAAENAPEPAAGSIRIGVITSLSGRHSAFGLAHHRGLTIALQELNAKGGVLGLPVELVTYDDRSTPEGAVLALNRLLEDDKVSAVIGSYSSDSTVPLVPVVTAKRVPLVVPSASSDKVLEPRSPWVFRLCASSSESAGAMVDFLKNHGAPKTIALVYENTSFGQSEAAAMRRLAAASGMTVVDEEAYSAGTLSFLPILQAIKQKKPEVIHFASYLLDAKTLMFQSRLADLNPRYFTAAGSGFSAPEFLSEETGAGKDAEYTIATAQWIPQVTWPGAKGFDEKFALAYGSHPAYHAMQAYSALKVIAAAIQQGASAEPAAIRDALRAIRLDTSFGPVHFAPNGQNEHPVLVTQAQKGKHVVVWPAAIAAAPALETPPWTTR